MLECEKLLSRCIGSEAAKRRRRLGWLFPESLQVATASEVGCCLSAGGSSSITGPLFLLVTGTCYR